MSMNKVNLYKQELLDHKLSKFPDAWKTDITKIWNEMQAHYQVKGYNMTGSSFDYDNDSIANTNKINVILRKMGKSTLSGCTHCIVNREITRFVISVNDVVYYERNKKLNTILCLMEAE